MDHKNKESDSTSESSSETKRKSSEEETITHEDHPSPTGDKSEEAKTSNESTADEEATESIWFFHALFLSLLEFIEPWYEYVKGYHPYVENVCNFVECVAKRLENFVGEHGGITNIKWDDVVKFLKSACAEFKSYFTGDNDLIVISHKYWHKTHIGILKSLEDIERIHDYLIPPIEGVEPLFKIDKNEKYKIRQLCFYLNMNLLHRIWLTISKSVSDWMVSSCSSKSKIILKQTEKSNEDSASTKETLEVSN